MMKLNTVLFFLLLNSIAFSQKSMQSEIVIHNTCKNDISVYYLDQLYYGKPLSIKKGKSEKVITGKPLYIFIADSNQHFIKAYPNDSVKVFENKNGVFFKAKNNINLNQFFNKLFVEVGTFRYINKNTPIKSTMSLKQRDSVIANLKTKRILFFNTNKKYLNDIDCLEAISAIESASIIEKLKLYSPGLNADSIRNYYEDSLDTFIRRINNGQNFPLNPFTEQAALKIFESKKFHNDTVNIYSLINNSFDVNLKNFLFARYLKEKIEDAEISLDVLNKLGRTVMENISDSNFTQILNEEIQFKNKQNQFSEKGSYLVDENDKYISFLDLIKIYKGNLIYIDFWASWCIPCLNEFPASQELQSQYRTKKIIFIFLSVDNNKKNWLDRQNSLKEVNRKNSYLLLNGFRSEIVSQQKIKSIPRYMIVEKNGLIVNADAPPPSDPKLKRLLDKLLLE